MAKKNDLRNSRRSLERAVGDITHSLSGLSGDDDKSKKLYEEARGLRDQTKGLLSKVQVMLNSKN